MQFLFMMSRFRDFISLSTLSSFFLASNKLNSVIEHLYFRRANIQRGNGSRIFKVLLTPSSSSIIFAVVSFFCFSRI